MVAASITEHLDGGLEASQGDVITFTDDDSVPRPDWLLRIENLFDSKYQEFVGFPAPGIYVDAGLQLTLGRRERTSPDTTSGNKNNAAWR